MTLLSTIQTVCKEIGLPVPETVIGNTDSTVRQMLAFLEREGKEVRSMWRWPFLNREYTWTLTSGTANYAFNTDYDYQCFRSHWDRTNQWELIGPISEAEWQMIKSGITSTSPRRRFRIKGVADGQIFIDPTPTSSGDTLVLEYQSLNWIRPKTWTASTSFAASSYTFYNGNYYQTTVGGVTGSTAPTHTSSSASDGGITWTYYSGTYETYTADTDVALLSEPNLELGLQWRFRREKALDWEAHRADAQDSWRRISMNKKGSRILSLTAPRDDYLISERNIPDTGYGQEP
jgi:hypothetical protein